MAQANLFPDLALPTSPAVVNVASVPQRSPFRYPGGKTWLVPKIRQWLKSLDERPVELIEPFVGGGIVSLTAAFESLTDRVTMVEKDEQVASVWETILNGGNRRLADRISEFEVSVESVQLELARTDVTPEDVAFQTILRNRVTHGGILAPGSGLLKNGENGRGIQSRWYPQTLRRRILEIGQVADRIRFIHGDGLSVMRDNAQRPDVVCFIDPPYTAAGKRAGKRLYLHNELDHEELFRLTSTLKGDFLMTYDNAEGVAELAKRHGFDTQPVAMKNTHHAQMTELLIGRDLDWVRRAF